MHPTDTHTSPDRGTLLAAEPASRLAAGGFTRWRPTDVDTVSRSQRGFHNLG